MNRQEHEFDKKTPPYKETTDLREALYQCGGSARFRYLLKEQNIPIYFSLVQNWINANQIPNSWAPKIDFIIRKNPEIVELELLRQFYGPPRTKAPLRSAESFKHPKLHEYIKSGNPGKHTGVKQFCAWFLERHALVVHPHQVYTWLDKGFIPNGRERTKLRMIEKLSVDILGLLPDGQPEIKVMPIDYIEGRKKYNLPVGPEVMTQEEVNLIYG